MTDSSKSTMRINGTLFKEAVNTVTRWIPSSPVAPVSALIMIKPVSNGLILQATDMSTGGISIFVKTEKSPNDGAPTILVDGKKLKGLLSALLKTSGELDITLNDKKIILSYSGHSVSINSSLTPEEFPEDVINPSLDDGDEVISLDANRFYESVMFARIAADPESPRPSLSGIYFHNGNVVSADGVRLLVCKGITIPGEPVLIPAASCVNIASAITKPGNVFLYRHNKRLVFKWGENTAVTSVLSYGFPDYEKVVPVENQTTVVANKNMLNVAFAIAKEFGSESLLLAVINVSGDNMYISSGASFGNEQSLIVLESKQGPDTEVGISCNYALAGLQYMDESVKISLNGPQGIVLLERDPYYYYTMPMHIKR